MSTFDPAQLQQAFATLSDSINGLSGSLNRTGEATRNVEETLTTRNANMDKAMAAAEQSLKSFGNALMSTERNFSKYNSALGSAGDAVLAFSKNLGPAGQALGLLVKGVTEVGKLYLEQADNLNKSTDALKKLGTAGAFTSEQFLAMAHRANLTSKNLEALVKPIQSLNNGIMSLGATTGEGVENFAKLTAITNKQREAYQRMGVSQEELIQNQADYIKLQSLSARNLEKDLKDTAKMQRLTLEYTDSLQVLSAITGKSADEVKKQQQEAANERRFQVSQIQAETKARQLEAQGRKEEAAKIRADAANKGAIMEKLSPVMGASMSKQLAGYLASGSFAGNTQLALLASQGFDVAGIRSGKVSVEQAMQQYQRAREKQVGAVGVAGMNNEKVLDTFGLDADTLKQLGFNLGKNFVETIQKIREQQTGAKGAGFDPAMDARAKLTTLEIEASKAMDKLVAATNPLIGEFNILKGVTTALAVAAAAATAALGAMAMGKGLGSIAGGAAGGASAAGRTAAGSMAKRIGAGGAMALGGIGASMLSDHLANQGNTKGAGLADAGSYALQGAGLGMMFGPMGAAVGGVLGGAYGLYKNWDKITGPGEAATAQNMQPTESQRLLDFIGKVESRGDYNIMVGGKRNPNLTNMTIGEVLQMQSSMIRSGHESTAVGKYQIIRDTLAGLVKEGAASIGDKFDQSTQDRLGLALLKRRGYDKFKNGQLSPDAFGNNLAQEWASLPMPNGGSFYSGVGSNKSLVSRAELIAAIGSPPKAERGGLFSGSRSGYPVELHGNELVAPITPGSILAKLVNTQESELKSSSTFNNSQINEYAAAANKETTDAIWSLHGKLDEVLYTLKNSLQTQNQLLQVARV